MTNNSLSLADTSYNVETGSTSYLPMVRIRAKSEATGKVLLLNALVDGGATNTISTFEVAGRLGLSGEMIDIAQDISKVKKEEHIGRAFTASAR